MMNGSINGEGDDFTHRVAIQLSRALNTLNPNDLLARRGKRDTRFERFQVTYGFGSDGYC